MPVHSARVDEFQLELQALRTRLSQLHEAEADVAIIEEYESELRNLTAIYNGAQQLFTAGESDPRLPIALAEIGFGEWTFSNAYSFVYDAAVDADLGDGDLATLVNTTDYAASLLALPDS